MKTPITSIKRLALALCLATPFVSWAAPTATAVWRSNLGQSYAIGGNTYAFAPGAGTLNGDGTITAPATWTSNLPSIDLEGKGVQAISVLVKYSGLDVAQVYTDDTGAIGVGFASILDSDNNVVGTCVQKSETTNPLRAYYAGSDDSNAQPLDIGSATVVEGTGYLLFSYQHNSGSRAYMGTGIDTLSGGQNTSGKYTNRTLKKLVIGGDASGKAWNGAGFKIEEVAVFVGSYLTNEDVADYVFPTVTVDPEITTMSALNTKVAALNNEFLYFTSAASVTLDVEPESATQTFLQSANWNGTVLIKDVTKTDIVPTKYGNKNSTLKLSGASGYFAKAQYTSAVTPEIELENSETEGKEYGFKQTNGYSFNSKGAYAYVNTPKLKGSGTLWGAWNGRAFYVVDDYSEFTGVLKLDTGDVVWLGVSLPETVSDVEAEVLQKYIRLGGTIPANVADWTAEAYDGTVRLTTAISSEDSYKGTFLQNSKWKGTCQLAWNPGNDAFDIVNYGNANSVIEITTNFGPYPTQNGGNAAANFAGEIRIAEGVTWTVSNGWDSKTTTFAKLSGGGTLTVNGTTSSSTAIPYTITRLENFTGTLAGGRGQFTIGTIVSSVEPTPGTKLVKCTTTNEPVLTSTKVTYGGEEQDVELEFKAGDGIYVKAVAYVVFQQESGLSFVDVTNYYSTVAAAIDAAKSLKKTVVLVAQPDEEDTYEIAAGETINVKKGDFTFDGIIFPTGPQYNNTTTVTADVTQYKCTVYTVTVQYPGQDPIGMSGQLMQILNGLYQNYMPAYAGTVVTVLDGSDATVGDSTPTVFTYDSENHTYTLKTMIVSVAVTEYATNYFSTFSEACTFADQNSVELVTLLVAREGIDETVPTGWQYNTPEASETTYGTLTKVTDTYTVTGKTELDNTGSFTVPAGTTKIKIGDYTLDDGDGISINGTTVTVLAPEVVEETAKKAVDVGATTVTLNVDLVEGLYYGVGKSENLTITKPTMTQYNGENGAAILTVDKPSAEKGFFKVFVDIKQ